MTPSIVPLHTYLAWRLDQVPPSNRTPMFRAIVRREWRRSRPQGYYAGAQGSAWTRRGSSARGTIQLAKALSAKMKIPWQALMQFVSPRAQSRPARRRRGR